MEVNYCEHQLARRLGWLSPAYLKRDSVTPHPVVCKHGGNMMGGSILVFGHRLGRET